MRTAPISRLLLLLLLHTLRAPAGGHKCQSCCASVLRQGQYPYRAAGRDDFRVLGHVDGVRALQEMVTGTVKGALRGPDPGKDTLNWVRVLTSAARPMLLASERRFSEAHVIALSSPTSSQALLVPVTTPAWLSMASTCEESSSNGNNSAWFPGKQDLLWAPSGLAASSPHPMPSTIFRRLASGVSPPVGARLESALFHAGREHRGAFRAVGAAPGQGCRLVDARLHMTRRSWCRPCPLLACCLLRYSHALFLPLT